MRKIAALSVVLCVVSVVGLCLWNGHTRDGVVTVTALDVGQGDAILLRTPHGSDVLIDGGAPDSGVVAHLAAHLPPSDHDLELVVVSHPDSDHVGGLADIAAHYRIDRYLDSGMTSTSTAYQNWKMAVDAQQATHLIARYGLTIDIDGVSCVVLWPGTDADLKDASSNDTSVVLRCIYSTTSFLFTGDATENVEARLLQRHELSATDVLKVSHHGSIYSSSSAFLDVLMPKFALVSVGAGNGYGHPHALILERLRTRGAVILRTDELGDVSVTSDGTAVRKGLDKNGDS